jgi:hypothetical protein
MGEVKRGLAGPEEGYPHYILAAYGVSRDWMEDAACSSRYRTGSEDWWWTIRPGTKKAGHMGEKWIAMAEQICQRCPVQWDCVKHAVDVGEVNTWALSETKRKLLVRHPGWRNVIDAAEAAEVPVHVAFVRMEQSRYDR